MKHIYFSQVRNRCKEEDITSKTVKLPRETSFVSLQSILPESNKIKEQPPVKRGDTSMMIENGNNGKVRKPRKLLFALRLQNITSAAGSGELPKQQLLSYSKVESVVSLRLACEHNNHIGPLLPGSLYTACAYTASYLGILYLFYKRS